jgi:hypothetical protein
MERKLKGKACKMEASVAVEGGKEKGGILQIIRSLKLKKK